MRDLLFLDFYNGPYQGDVKFMFWQSTRVLETCGNYDKFWVKKNMIFLFVICWIYFMNMEAISVQGAKIFKFIEQNLSILKYGSESFCGFGV